MSFGITSTSSIKKPSGNLSNDVQLSFSPGDTVSSLAWSPVADHLAVASWDNKVRVYNVPQGSTGTGVAVADFDGPVLSCDWSKDGRMIVGAGADKTARLLDLSANGSSAHQVAAHEGPIRSIRFFELLSTREQLIVTGSWDRTVKYWDLRSPTPAGLVPIHEKVYSLDTKDNILVIATAERKLHVVDLRNPTKIFKSPDCPLRHQIRVVTCFPDGQGFGVGGIEGRIGMIWNGDTDTKRNYSFKYPRETGTSNSITNIYSVNAISFHPTLKNIFSTAGSDGSFHFWDRDAHTRVKQFSNAGAGEAITATGFTCDGSTYAYAVGYDWSKGFMANRRGQESKVFLHRVLEDEVANVRALRKK